MFSSSKLRTPPTSWTWPSRKTTHSPDPLKTASPLLPCLQEPLPVGFATNVLVNWDNHPRFHVYIHIHK